MVSGESMGDLECARMDMIARDGRSRILKSDQIETRHTDKVRLTGDDDIDVIVNDLSTEPRGRMERGCDFGIGGELEGATGCDKGMLTGVT